MRDTRPITTTNSPTRDLPRVTVVVPSFNQGRFLEAALQSIVDQSVLTEIIVLDGGSNDGSIDVLERWSDRLKFWRSAPDRGQAAAINEGIQMGAAPYVCWLNSDDLFLPGGLDTLVAALDQHAQTPAAYGNVDNLTEPLGNRRPVWVEPFNRDRLARRCIISQPGCLIRRSSWEGVSGVDADLHMAMDYDLWWRLSERYGPFVRVPQVVAINREHDDTKTRNNRALHYREAMRVVKRHYGRVPARWWLAQPYSVWWKALVARFSST